MTDLEILRLHTDELFRLIQQHGDIYEQIKAVKDILKDVQGEIRIETTSINGSERISKIDVAPTSITLFQEFNLTSPHIDASFIALSRLYEVRSQKSEVRILNCGINRPFGRAMRTSKGRVQDRSKASGL